MEYRTRDGKYRLIEAVGHWVVVPVLRKAECDGGAVPVILPASSGNSGLPYMILVGAGVAAYLLYRLTRHRKPSTLDKTTNTDTKFYMYNGDMQMSFEISSSLDAGASNGEVEFSFASSGVLGAGVKAGRPGAGASDAVDGRNNNAYSETLIVQETITKSTASKSGSAPDESPLLNGHRPETDDKATQVLLLDEHALRTQIEVTVKRDVEVQLRRDIEAQLSKDIEAKLRKEIEEKLRKDIQAQLQKEYEEKLKSLEKSSTGKRQEGTDVDGVDGSGALFDSQQARMRFRDFQDVSDVCKDDLKKLVQLQNDFSGMCERVGRLSAQIVESGTTGVPHTSADSILNDTDALGEQWLDIRSLLFCINTHLLNSQLYHTFHYEVEKLQAALEALEKEVAKRPQVPSSSQNVTELNAAVSQLKDAQTNLENYGSSIERLCGTSKAVYPVHLRAEPFDDPLPVKMLCGYEDSKVSLESDELLLLTDNSDQHTWKLRGGSGDDVSVPAMCCVIPPPDVNTMKTVARLEVQYKDLSTRLRAYYTTTISDLARHVTQLLASKDIKSMSPEQRQELLTLVQMLETFTSTYLSDRADVVASVQRVRERVTELLTLTDTSPDAALSELIELLKLWQGVDTLYEQSELSAQRRRQLVQQGTLLDSEETEWDELEEVVEARRAMAQVSITMATETAAIGETSKYQQAISETRMTFTIKAVKDARDDSEMSMDEAVARGIIDQTQGVYKNLLTGEQYPIPVAMNAGFIIVENTTTVKSKELKRSLGVISVEFKRETRPYTVISVLDPNTQQQVPVQTAIDTGLLDTDAKQYINSKTGDRMKYEDAVDSGALLVQYDDSEADAVEPEITKKTFAVSSVLNRKSGKRVTFDDAVDAGLILKDRGVYVDTLTDEQIPLVDAMQRQYVRARVMADPARIDRYMSRMRTESMDSLDLDSRLSDGEA